VRRHASLLGRGVSWRLQKESPDLAGLGFIKIRDGRALVAPGAFAAAHGVAFLAFMLIQGCGTSRPVVGEPEPVMPPMPVPPTKVVLTPGGPVQPVHPVVHENTTTYTVAKGDSVSSIAQRFGVRTSDIAALNNIKDLNRVRIGQTLVIPVKNGQVAPVAPRPRMTSAPRPVPGGQTYVVAKGDSISVLAKRFGTTSPAIREANGLTTDMIRIGQKLVIPPGSSGAATSGASDRVPAPVKTETPRVISVPPSGAKPDPMSIAPVPVVDRGTCSSRFRRVCR
jgi:LysM repeat protein